MAVAEGAAGGATAARVAFPALGTEAVLLVADPGRLPPARDAVISVIDRVDRACSRFRDDSDLAAVNRGAGRAVAVSPVLLAAVEVAVRAAQLTDGDVDPTIGEAMKLVGYDRDFAAVDREGAAPVARFQAAAGWRLIRVDRARRTLRVPEGVTLDLGATAKAWAADVAAADAAEAAGCGVLVGLGGDIAIAGPAPDGGWPVRVADAHNAPASAPGQTISLESGGVATSSTTVRRWRRADDDLHHVLDPRTGRPAEVVWRTVSVVAGTCADANAASTAAVIRGDAAPSWLEAAGLPARLVRRDGSTVRVAGWPEPAEGER